MLAARLFAAIALSLAVCAAGAARADDTPRPKPREPDKALVKALKDAVVRAATGAKEETQDGRSCFCFLIEKTR